MLKPSPGSPTTSSLLSNFQGVHWSRQRLLAISSQLIMLVVTLVLVVNVIITLGERRLLEEWATQRYSELQTVGAMLTDKVTFQQFRTQTVARSELLRRYLDRPDEALGTQLLEQWSSLQKNMPVLMGIALFDAQGQLMLASNDSFDNQTLPASLLGTARNMGGNEIYTSPIEFLSVNGQLEPYLYQLAWLEYPDQRVRGYLVTYNSVSLTLKQVGPAIGSNPVMLFDTQGLMLGGDTDESLPWLPDGPNGNLRQSYPALWQHMSLSNFGQFHGDDAAFVYLKVDLTTQYETLREYFLLSYIHNDSIVSRFYQWRWLLIAIGLVTALLAAAVIVLAHLYRLEQRARYKSVQLAVDLFSGDEGQMLVNQQGRILSANDSAGRLLNFAGNQQLADRSLLRCLQLDDDAYTALMACIDTTGEWRGELVPDDSPDVIIRVHIRQTLASQAHQRYYLVSLYDVSELANCQREEALQRLLADSAVATALARVDGTLLKYNRAFEQLMDQRVTLGSNLAQLLENDLDNQWPRISQLVAMQGSWQGQLLHHNDTNSCLQTTLKGHPGDDGDIEYLVCTLEQARGNHTGRDHSRFLPNRSTILANIDELQRYYDALGEQSRADALLLMIDISPAGLLSHMSDVGQLEKRQQEVEMLLLKELPSNSQISHWQLGKLVIIQSAGGSKEAHQVASETLELLSSHGLGDGVSIGIAAHQPGDDLEHFINHAEIALKRAKQTGEQKICQAFTR